MTDLSFLRRQKSTQDAPPDPVNVEEEIRKFAPKQPRTAVIGNVADMERVRELITNSVTDAHDDAGRAVDRVLAEAQNLMGRIEKAAEKHKLEIRERGQKIAHDIDAAIQELTKTIQWVEDQTPQLRTPKLENHAPLLPPRRPRPDPKPQEPESESEHD